jgi:CheY-like chemotaxis protein
MTHTINIILTDDDPDDCYIFSSLSKEVNEKVKITCFTDCMSLLVHLEHSDPPDIIFLDLNMPILSGQDCLKNIKDHPAWKKIPVVIYSTAARKNIIDECYELGASLYIVKPNDSESLRGAIRLAIKQLVP